MTIFLEIDPRFSDPSDFPNFIDCALAVFQEQGIQLDSDITIVIVDDDEIHRLNREYLAQDKRTDVLAFPAGHLDPDTGHKNFGDVIISYPRAEIQAIAGGHQLSSELSLLAVHGVLHLLGYDHDLPESEIKMWQAQTKILSRLGIEINTPHFSTHIGS